MNLGVHQAIKDKVLTDISEQLRKAHYENFNEVYIDQTKNDWAARAYVIRHLIKKMGNHLGSQQEGQENKNLLVNEIAPGTGDVMAQVLPKLIKQKTTPFNVKYSAVDRGDLDKAGLRIRNKVVNTYSNPKAEWKLHKIANKNGTGIRQQQASYSDEANPRICELSLKVGDGLHGDIASIRKSLELNQGEYPDVLVLEHALYPYSDNPEAIDKEIVKLSQIVKPENGLGIFSISCDSDINYLRQRYNNSAIDDKRKQQGSDYLFAAIQKQFGENNVKKIMLHSQMRFPILSEEQWKAIRSYELDSKVLETDDAQKAIQLIEFWGEAPAMMKLKEVEGQSGGWKKYIDKLEGLLNAKDHAIHTNTMMIIAAGKESSPDFLNQLNDSVSYLKHVVDKNEKIKEGGNKVVDFSSKVEKYSKRATTDIEPTFRRNTFVGRLFASKEQSQETGITIS